MAEGVAGVSELRRRANDLFSRGEVAEARKEYLLALESARRCDVSDPTVRSEILRLHLNLAACCLRLEDHESVLKHCESALKSDSRCVKAYYRRAKAYLALDDVPAALSNAQEAARLAPGNEEVKEILEQAKNSFESQGWNRRLEEQVFVMEAKRLVSKLQRGEVLSKEEMDTLQAFRKEEIRRLEEKEKTTGIYGEEKVILERLKESILQEERRMSESEAIDRRAEEYLNKLNSGRRVPIRDRMEMKQMLREEADRLRMIEEERGLDSNQLRTLQSIDAFLRDTKKR